MGIYGMMRTGVSGMNAQSNRLSGVADNVANSSTIGYKRTDTQFSSLVMPSTRNAYASGGVNTHVRHDITMQGVARSTMRLGDAMINGNGFFRVQDSTGAEYMTRAGSFQRDGDGFLQNAAGYFLLDENGQKIQIKGGASDMMPAEQTTKMDMSMNLKADEKNITTPFDANDSSTYHQKKSVTVYDQQGSAVVLDVYLTKTADNTWSMNIMKADNTTTPPTHQSVLSNQQLTFDADGKLNPISPAPQITVPGNNGATFPVTLNLNDNVTQQGSTYAFEMKPDGMAPGAYESFTFGKDGEVMVTYSNGKTVQHSTVGMTTVTSPDMLTTLSGTVFQVNSETGSQMFGRPGEGTFGQLNTGVLEDSNADIGDELTDMIEAQRNYTANSKVFQTGSELMDVIVNLKR
ncbi:flagellar hook protein FlgE [Bartonella sp. LJL80]